MDIEKDLKSQEHTGDPPTQMSSEEHAEWLRMRNIMKKYNIATDPEKRRAAYKRLHIAIVLGAIGFALGWYSNEAAGSLTGVWVALIFSGVGMVFTLRSIFDSNMPARSGRGSISFLLCAVGILYCLSAMGVEVTPY